MSSSQTKSERVVQKSLHFNADSADFIFISTEGVDAAGLKQASCRFKVHRDKLRAASPVFADMLSLGEMQDNQSKASVVPSVQLTETTIILDIVLRSIYNDISALPDFKTIAPQHILEIFEAAAKYDLVMLQVLTEILIRFNLTLFSPKHALTLLDRACVFKRKQLAAEVARVYVAQVKILNNKESILAHLPAEALLLLITEQNLLIEKNRIRDKDGLALLESRIADLSLQPQGHKLQDKITELKKGISAYKASVFAYVQ